MPFDDNVSFYARESYERGLEDGKDDGWAQGHAEAMATAQVLLAELCDDIVAKSKVMVAEVAAANRSIGGNEEANRWEKRLAELRSHPYNFYASEFERGRQEAMQVALAIMEGRDTDHDNGTKG